MPSISDLGKPASPEALPDNLYDGAAKAAMLRMQSEDLARIGSLLSGNISTRLEVPRAAVHEMVVETPPIVEIMREQAAYARRQALDAQRPWWKKSGGWSLIVSVMSLIVAIVALSDFKYSVISLWTYLTNLLNNL